MYFLARNTCKFAPTISQRRSRSNSKLDETRQTINELRILLREFRLNLFVRLSRILTVWKEEIKRKGNKRKRENESSSGGIKNYSSNIVSSFNPIL